MAEFLLKERTGFNLDRATREEWDGFSIAEIEGEPVWWLSVPRGNGEGFAGAVRADLDIDLPEAGMFRVSSSSARLYHAGDRQYFLTGAGPGEGMLREGFATDQSAGWLGLAISGRSAREVFSRLCGMDFHPSVFPSGACARSPFEGMLALIGCEDTDEPAFRVLFQRSSARSFLDHLRHAASSVCGPASGGRAH